jgi:hypothetical protein
MNDELEELGLERVSYSAEARAAMTCKISMTDCTT